MRPSGFSTAPIVLCVLSAAFAQAPPENRIYKVGNGVMPPRVLHKVDPKYSKEAEREFIQGTALYQVVVDAKGRAQNIDILSPVGYGLDEKGEEAIRQWVFAPGTKDGIPVNIRAQITVNFRFAQTRFDEQRERRRTAYNAAVHNLRSSERNSAAIESIFRLAAEKYPPAMTLAGQWTIRGENVPADVPGGIALIRSAASQHESNGLFIMGALMFEGTLLPRDRDAGLKLLKEASMYGSEAAQSLLGKLYESGSEPAVEASAGRARQYFRLCAARGNAECQAHLGKSLLLSADSNDIVQALAWLELAGSEGDAAQLAETTRARLANDDFDRVAKLKTQLVRH